MWIPGFIKTFLGHEAARELGLQEVNMADPTVDTSVAWYKNVSIISHIFQAGVGIVGLVVGVLAGDFHMSISPILAKIGTGLLTVGGLLGIYHNTSNE